MIRRPNIVSLHATLKRSLQCIVPIIRKEAAILSVLSPLSVLVPVGVIWGRKEIVDAAVTIRAAYRSGEPVNFSTIEFWCAVFVGVVATSSLTDKIFVHVRRKAGRRLQQFFCAELLKRPSGPNDSAPPGSDTDEEDQVRKLRRESIYQPVGLVEDLLWFISNLLMVLGYSFLLIKFSFWAVLGSIACAAPLLIASLVAAVRRNRASPTKEKGDKFASYLEDILSSKRHEREIGSFDARGVLVGLYQKAQPITDPGSINTPWSEMLLQFGSIVLSYFLYVEVVMACVKGHSTLGAMTLYLAAIRRSKKSAEGAARAFGTLMDAIVYMKKYFGVLDQQSAPPADVSKSENRPTFTSLALDGVGYRYSAGADWALKNISFVFPVPGVTYVLGDAGAGKSTLLNILAGMSEPTAGTRRTADSPATSPRLPSAWPRVSILFQEYGRYHMTLRMCVSLGHLDVESDPKIIEALITADLQEFYASLPRGLDTPIGRRVEEGVIPTPEEWQKIAFARAIYRANTELLLLDEPMSEMSEQSCDRLSATISSLGRSIGVIVFTKRFHLAVDQPRILVLKNGRIAENGSHHDLLMRGGVYAKSMVRHSRRQRTAAATQTATAAEV